MNQSAQGSGMFLEPRPLLSGIETRGITTLTALSVCPSYLYLCLSSLPL